MEEVIEKSEMQLRPESKIYIIIVTFNAMKWLQKCLEHTTPRNENATLAINDNPEKYNYWWKNIIANFQPYSEEENFVFKNAMKQWAEGIHLEPCTKYGRQYFETTKKALKEC